MVIASLLRVIRLYNITVFFPPRFRSTGIDVTATTAEKMILSRMHHYIIIGTRGLLLHSNLVGSHRGYQSTTTDAIIRLVIGKMG